MRVLVVHNRYSSLVPSGENMAVEDEVRWLREAGVKVAVHEATNDDLLSGGLGTKVRMGFETIWSPSAQARFKGTYEAFQPDIVHVHNLFPLLTGSVPSLALRKGTPVVWTVHNNRVICVDGTHFRDGHPCHACKQGWRLPGIRYGCYRDSTAASVLVTGATSIFRRVARQRLTTLAISEHIRRWLIESAGFYPARVHTKYNGVSGPSDAALPDPASCNTFLFVAKLAEFKGVSLLLDTWRLLPKLKARLRVIGDGPMADRVQAAASTDDRIMWTGQISPEEMTSHLADARAVIVPSIWEEPFGRTAAEAMAHGRPVITTGTGGLAEIVSEASGWLTGTDSKALAKAIEEATTSDEAIRQRSTSANERYLKLFSPLTTTQALIQIYETLLRTSSPDPTSPT